MYGTEVLNLRIVYGQKNNSKSRGRVDRRDAWKGTRQLVICLILFLCMYIGKGVFPDQMARTGRSLITVIGSNIDLEHALETLGKGISPEQDLMDGLVDFCVQVFAAKENTVEQQDEVCVDESAVLTVASDSEALKEKEDIIVPAEEVEMPEAAEMTQTMEVGQVVRMVEVTGSVLPEQYCPHVLHLGLADTAVPVNGRITSQYGYREHPTIGRHSIHNGVDIGADSGAAVCAFAAGRISQVGENDDYGKYIYIDHGNGIETFYAHCSSILAEEGEQVMAGDSIARVGQTGKATGPHLHFELRFNGTYLDPIHYIDLE